MAWVVSQLQRTSGCLRGNHLDPCPVTPDTPRGCSPASLSMYFQTVISSKSTCLPLTLFIYLFLAVPGLPCYVGFPLQSRAFGSCSPWSQRSGVPGGGPEAQLLPGGWDLLGSGVTCRRTLKRWASRAAPTLVSVVHLSFPPSCQGPLVWCFADYEVYFNLRLNLSVRWSLQPTV